MTRTLLVFIFAAVCVAVMAAMPISELGLLNPPVAPDQAPDANVPQVTTALLKYHGKNPAEIVSSLNGLRDLVISMPALLPATTFTKVVTVKKAPAVDETGTDSLTSVEEVTEVDEVVTDEEGTPLADITAVEDVVTVEDTPQAPAEKKTDFNANFPFYSYSLFLALAMVASAIAFIAIGSIDREEKTVLPVKK